MNRIRMGLIITTTLLFVACSAGSNFVRPTDDKYELGNTTKAQITALMGSPRSKGEIIKNGSTVEFIRYSFGDPTGTPLFEGVTPAKNISFFFANDVLVGSDYTSSFKEGTSYFDPLKAKTIKEGMAMTEVISILGKPGGEYRYPMIEDKEGRAYMYVYSQMRGRLVQNSFLRVEGDREGVVRKIEYVQAGL